MEATNPPPSGAVPEHLLKMYSGETEWLEAMAADTPVFFKGFEQIWKGVFGRGLVPLKVKELIVGATFAAQDYARGSELHFRNAIEAGATRIEISEILTAAVISRGEKAYVTGHQTLPFCTYEDNKGRASATDVSETSVADIVKYFNGYYGKYLPHVRLLVEGGYYDVLRGYYTMRAEVLRDASLPRKYKEFLLMVINGASMFVDAMRIHVKGSLDCGATKEEIFEAMLLVIPTGGVAAWLGSVTACEDLLGSSPSSVNTGGSS